MFHLIGVGGEFAAGKDALIDQLIAASDVPIKKMGMSDPLRDTLGKINPIVREDPTIPLDQDQYFQEIEARITREIPVSDPARATRILLGTPPTHGGTRFGDLLESSGYVAAKRIPEVRRMLQVLGTEIGRNMVSEDYWVQIAEATIRRELQHTNVAITGIRFPNELRMIHTLHGTSIWVSRPGTYHHGVTASHASEHSVSADMFNLHIVNAGTLTDLRKTAVQQVLPLLRK